MCACRAFSPLQGFMNEQEYNSVVEDMRLPVRPFLHLPRLELVTDERGTTAIVCRSLYMCHIPADCKLVFIHLSGLPLQAVEWAPFAGQICLDQALLNRTLCKAMYC